ncbi:M14 family zinc carboxypeptidase [Pseudobdellovibrio exovorus]|uniref:Putative carboxypeptidase n=1 Tax=Pseudobdellovibrio exovorus JSS TaxID=1184267 RepID=M4V662_9BACT|nr:M14 family zinc carboxypeptidase [Pseudobdellovibrio exovorus]AGH94683.1 putative carboxypeptidase [Pseudobdellovibrio exovorus JSS]
MRHFLWLFLFLHGGISSAESISLKQKCIQALQNYKSYYKDPSVLERVCAQAEQKEGCTSNEGVPIFHVDSNSKSTSAKKILVISLIHGDETEAGTLGRFWMERLQQLESSRNSWRVIPVANPDGVKRLTRTNANGVDLNRNFPTKDWNAEALKNWERQGKKSPRRFPGNAGGDEVETKCLMGHAEDYSPDFVVSIHTPLKVLDFDGPKLNRRIRYDYLPWRSLGNFPGSLGRYLWVERHTPVLTTELKSTLPESEGVFEQLQDLIGSLIQSDLSRPKVTTANDHH